ncbi:MAG TPA: acyltransferase family protein [Micromonosporaceae bacterium]
MATPRARSAGSGWRYRPALDGVRAFAVAAVVLFHGGVGLLSGGFLGVDAFFVLSGFLITSLLLAERAATGTIRLVAFWGRRARRLLPALLIVLLVVVTLGRGLQRDDVSVGLLRGDALAALGYVANWRMIYRGSDYFTASAAPSPLQHTWSLGIEEQFYLIWPVVVLALLGIGAWKQSRPVLLTVCLVGAGESAIAGAVLYRADDVNRAYFGTDTRAQALLIGAAVAVVLAGRPNTQAADRPAARSRVASVAFGAAALVGVLGTAWLWTHARGTDGWLYRGGLTAGAVGIAAVIAHAVLSPTSVTARVLSLAPIVWLGKISYGVYLWHWPLFQYLDAERTGLGGANLLALRCAALLAISIASYVLVERPIRTGRWRARLPRPVPVAAAMVGVVAVAGTAAVVLAGTAPVRPQAVRSASITLSPPPTATYPTATAPMSRPGRRPGAQPRIDVFGDSVAWTLGKYLPQHPKLHVKVRAMQGCGIARLPDIRQLDAPHTNYPGCTRWDERWRRGVQTDDPDVAVILLDRWELMDRRLGGVYQHVGDPAYDTYLTSELGLAVSIAGARGARVVLLTAPYTHRAERPDGSLYGEDRPERVNAWNRLLREYAAQHRDQVTVLDLNTLVCPKGRFTWSIDGLRVRSDGLHFTPDGVQQVIAPWLFPRLWSIATTGSP